MPAAASLAPTPNPERQTLNWPGARRRARRWPVLLLLAALLLAAMIVSTGIGAVKISPLQVIAILFHKLGIPADTLTALHPKLAFTDQQAAVLHAIRLPRVVLGVLVGAALAVSGAALQGLFRNPLADPRLLGVSSGASLAVAAAIVLGIGFFGVWTLPVVAFVGSTAVIALIYALARKDRRTNVATMLLAGIAINALCDAGTGIFTYFSDEDQLRAITFWLLGSLGNATWTSVLGAGPPILLCLAIAPFLANTLNALLLGEANARHLGIPVETAKWLIVALVALGVGASVAMSGMIGFVGLVVPHLIRLWRGPNHRLLLPASALLGALLLVLADLAARTIVSPLELPIGIVTAALGAPFFLYLLLRKKSLNAP
ncbi:ABC-type Fe3+-siderophore transport system, permease component [Opitutaceae bacterium TAV1]|nr:ABC-type Fe3+-siderophore transport system, permease component [Opitutaceae bacterium TAV1]